ncbi:hypothetical protein [Dawidia soli]|uniref:Uncharacterized protein n=1 Tax=Dawidia soli TaxID=2782352 RepID=A0AAP2GJY3_9BACT|nr:hypothetical protein [Dawidia soli]MBT1689871.1 hypothetical protein [Dawidia soli]
MEVSTIYRNFDIDIHIKDNNESSTAGTKRKRGKRKESSTYRIVAVPQENSSAVIKETEIGVFDRQENIIRLYRRDIAHLYAEVYSRHVESIWDQLRLISAAALMPLMRSILRLLTPKPKAFIAMNPHGTIYAQQGKNLKYLFYNSSIGSVERDRVVEKHSAFTAREWYNVFEIDESDVSFAAEEKIAANALRNIIGNRKSTIVEILPDADIKKVAETARQRAWKSLMASQEKKSDLQGHIDAHSAYIYWILSDIRTDIRKDSNDESHKHLKDLVGKLGELTFPQIDGRVQGKSKEAAGQANVGVNRREGIVMQEKKYLSVIFKIIDQDVMVRAFDLIDETKKKEEFNLSKDELFKRIKKEPEEGDMIGLTLKYKDNAPFDFDAHILSDKKEINLLNQRTKINAKLSHYIKY